MGPGFLWVLKILADRGAALCNSCTRVLSIYNVRARTTVDPERANGDLFITWFSQYFSLLEHIACNECYNFHNTYSHQHVSDSQIEQKYFLKI